MGDIMVLNEFEKDDNGHYKFTCPICKCQYGFPTLRYYNILICNECSSRAVDKNGREVTFFEGFEKVERNGAVVYQHIGLIGQYVDTGENYPSAKFFIDGFECHAQEGHFGGVVYLFGKDE